MSRTFTRNEFYDLVWSRPMTHLAKEFAFSDVALHKICRKHNLPNPPLGWWAKKAAGKKVTQTQLPKATSGSTGRIVIAGGELRNEPQMVAEVREHARVRASCAPFGETRSDPIVERTIARMRKGKSGPTGLVSVDAAGLIKCEVAPSSIERLEKILTGIVAAAARQGFSLGSEDGSTKFVGEEESIAFSVLETVRRVKHELTDREQADEERWKRKQERARLRNDWDSVFLSRPRFAEWDYYPTGRLSFELEQIWVREGVSPRRSFRDAKVQRLENMASDIAVGMAVLAVTKKAERLRREEEHRRAKEQRRLRELALRARHVEERRTAALDSIIGEVEHADRVRRMLGALHYAPAKAADVRIAEFVRWTEAHLAARESALETDALRKRFEDERLFGEDDDHAFRPPHWF